MTFVLLFSFPFGRNSAGCNDCRLRDFLKIFALTRAKAISALKECNYVLVFVAFQRRNSGSLEPTIRMILNGILWYKKPSDNVKVCAELIRFLLTIILLDSWS